MFKLTDRLEKAFIPVRDLHFHFARTGYGKKLWRQARYGRYKPAGMGSAKWENILGPDVNNLEHGLITFDNTLEFVDRCHNPPPGWQRRLDNFTTDCLARFSFSDMYYLLLTSIIHDWGEVIMTDVMRDLKTNEQAREEKRHLARICREISESFYDGLLTDDMEFVISHILDNTTSKLGQAFEMIEFIGYMKTALNAFRQSYRPDFPTANLLWLTTNVLIYQVRELTLVRMTYPAIHIFLNERQNDISLALTHIPYSVFDHYEPDEKKIKQAMFEETKKLWFQN